MRHIKRPSRAVTISAVTAILLGSGTGAAVAAIAAPAAPVSCATYYILQHHRIGVTAPYLYFKFCGRGIQPSKWTCLLAAGAPVIDARVNCTRQ